MYQIENRAHLALAIILSVFVGLVISMFFILDHSRRVKAKKKSLLKKSKRIADTIRDMDDGDEEGNLMIHNVLFIDRY